MSDLLKLAAKLSDRGNALHFGVPNRADRQECAKLMRDASALLRALDATHPTAPQPTEPA